MKQDLMSKRDLELEYIAPPAYCNSTAYSEKLRLQKIKEAGHNAKALETFARNRKNRKRKRK